MDLLLEKCASLHGKLLGRFIGASPTAGLFASTEYIAQNSLLCGLHQQLSSIYPHDNCGKAYSWIIAQGFLLVFWGRI